MNIVCMIMLYIYFKQGLYMLASTQLTGFSESINPISSIREEISLESNVPQPPSVDELKFEFDINNVDQKVRDESAHIAKKCDQDDDPTNNIVGVASLLVSIFGGTTAGSLGVLLALGTFTSPVALIVFGILLAQGFYNEDLLGLFCGIAVFSVLAPTMGALLLLGY